MDLDIRLARMDENGIDLQVLSPNPITYFHHIETEVAAEFCHWHNDVMAETVAKRPDRLRGFAEVPIQSPSAAVVEMRRAVTDLGLVGPYIGTESVYALDAPEMDEFYAAAVELDVPVFIHPAPHGIDSPLADPRIRRFDLDLYLGFLYEETIAVASLIYGGVLDRHPALDVCISHGGGASIWLRGRMALAARNRPWSPEGLKVEGAYEDQLRRLYFDNHLDDPVAFQALIDVVGPEQRRQWHELRRLGRCRTPRHERVEQAVRRQRSPPAPHGLNGNDDREGSRGDWCSIRDRGRDMRAARI